MKSGTTIAAGAALVLGQRATAEKSNEKTAIPELLATLALEGCIVTIDAMGAQPNIAQAIRARDADYVLLVKNNQPKLTESMQDFVAAFLAAPDKTPYHFAETVEKDHGRIETRRCYAFDQLDCLHAPERWPDLKSFAVIFSERTIKGKTTVEQRCYISSLPADAIQFNRAANIGAWRIVCTGASTLCSATIKCVRAPITPPIISPSCDSLLSMPSVTPSRHARERSRFAD